MPNFGNYKKLEIDSTKLIDYPLPIMGMPVLKLAPATSVNKPLSDAMKRYNMENPHTRKLEKYRTPVQRKQDEENLIELYALYVIKGWEGIVDEDNNEVLYSSEAAKELLNALPQDMVLDLVHFAQTPDNWRESGNVLHVEEAAKN